jgi:O-antigen/teichoic acid export membrane protein
VHSADIQAVAAIARRGVSTVIVLMAPVAVGMSLVASDLIAFFPYPAEFANSVPVLRLMAINIAVTSQLTILGTIAIAVNRQRAWAIALAFTVAINIGLNLFAIPFAQDAYGNGGIGAAASTVATELLMVLVGLYMLRRVLFDKGLAIMASRAVIAVAGMGLAVFLGRTAGLGLWPLVAIGVIIYLILVLAVRAIHPDEVRFIWNSLVSRVRVDGRRDEKERATHEG